jgi:hypothetical protein
MARPLRRRHPSHRGVIVSWQVLQQRIPEDAQHQVRLEHEIRGHDVILVERRRPWDAPTHSSAGNGWPVPSRRHSAVGWRLYWPDSDNRWYLQSEFQFGAQQRNLGQA